MCGNVRVLVVKRGEAFATRRAYAVRFEISHKYVYMSIKKILMRVENTYSIWFVHMLAAVVLHRTSKQHSSIPPHSCCDDQCF